MIDRIRNLELKLPILTLCILSLLGCSTLKSESDYDPSVDFGKLKNYAWLPDQPRGGTRVLHTNGLLLDRVRNSIDQALANKGLKAGKEEDADFLIRSLVTEELLPTTTPATGSSEQTKADSTTKTRGALRYENVALIIDFLEPQDQALIWRGQGEKKVERNTTAQVREAAIEELVGGILSRYPPGTR